ncbi:MAG TPA: UPF0182 family protein [bacterium]|jgi:hypothetical protein|nr:UPF0182 family protein [bacterium]
MRFGLRLLILALLVILFILAPTLARWYTDWLWFGEVGYRRVFWVPLLSRIGVTLTVGSLLFVLLLLNVLPILRRFRAAPDVLEMEARGRGRFARRLRRGLPGFRLAVIVIALVSFVVGLGASGRWTMFQQFVYAAPFGVPDPLFGIDVGFFVFKLPVYQWASGFLFNWLIVALAIVLVGSYLDMAPLLVRGLWSVPLRVRAHVSLLVGLILLARGWGFWLDAYGLVYSPTGVVTGAGYTDVHVVLPALRVMTVFFVLAAALMFANVRLRTLRLAAVVIVVTAVAWLVGLRLAPGLVQTLRVRPSELTLETPFIQRSITGTLAGYGLTRVVERDFPGRAVTAEEVARNRATLDNTRLWDYRPLLTAYRQLQTLRQYYTFLDVDIDRYRLPAGQRQVMLAAREMDIARLAVPARSWVNEHMVFTHGFGLVMSPVNRISEEGMPELWVRDIPPESVAGPTVSEPRIYFGELTNHFVVVRTRVQELDFPRGNENVYTTYRGKGGIRLSYFARLAFAYRFADLKLAISSDIGSDSRLLFARNIVARVQRIAPFLRYDRDPYLVVADGRLVWVIDAYAQSDRYPYSTPVQAGINYIRNSVKVVIDAYDGSVTFYRVDPTDPVAATLARIFPELFQPASAVPPVLAAHFRYPVDLFEIQAYVYSTFHMRDPRVFYNREDVWAIPNEIFGSETVPVEPYYVTMRLGDDRAAPPEFVLILPFTPLNRDNLIAWMGVRNDAPHYGEILVYRFPKASIVFGPMQVESRINQDPQISSAITLWNQQGSRVIRGNLLVIPIEDGLLYVEPLFLQAERSQLPELKRIIVATGPRIQMAETFDAALAGVLGRPSPPSGPGAPPPVGPPGAPGPATPGAAPVDEAERNRLIAEALATYRRAQERLRAGDLTGYSAEIERLGKILERLAAGAR